MWLSPAVLLLAGLSTPSIADPVTFTIGDLAQYKLQANPPVDGNVITVSGDLTTGISVAFSKALGDKVKASAKDACKTFSNECFQGVSNAAKQHGIIDARSLHDRQVVEGAVVVVGLIIHKILMAWEVHSTNYESEGHVIPPKKFDQALATASEIAVVTEEGKPAVTVTQDLAPPAATGADAPSFKIYAEAADGFDKGDLVITLPEGLAPRIQEIMSRSEECSLGDEGATRRDLLDPRAGSGGGGGGGGGGAAGCRGQGMISNVAFGGPLMILRMMHMGNINFLDPGFTRAANALIAWARRNAARLHIPAPDIDHVAILGYVLGIIVGFGQALQRINVFKAKYLDANHPTIDMPAQTLKPTTMPTPTSTGTTSTSSCSGVCTVSCSLRGVIQFCQTGCPSCTPKPTVYSTVEFKDWTWPTTLPEVRSLNECSGDMSELPWAVFKDIPAKFCAEVGKNPTKALSWIVNSVGDQAAALSARDISDVEPEPRPWLGGLGSTILARLRGRSPPPNANSYKDFRVTLKWEPRDGEQELCASSCADTYKQLEGGQCNPNSAEGKTMKQSGSTDNMCGIYSYAIQAPPKNNAPPPTPLTLQPQYCHPKPTEHHGDISWSQQERWSNWLCEQPNIQISMKPGDKPILWTPTQVGRDALLSYGIHWVEGCTTTVGAQSVRNPMEGVACKDLLRQSYTNCDNTGVGGHRQAGCLRYDFWGH